MTQAIDTFPAEPKSDAVKMTKKMSENFSSAMVIMGITVFSCVMIASWFIL